ncbi:hypothetical protein C8J56DRAFT_884513 [Mycena floridula]|nr:hypothetical protein C8J56DRAFT_884513 [Mycena floridula]
MNDLPSSPPQKPVDPVDVAQELEAIEKEIVQVAGHLTRLEKYRAELFKVISQRTSEPDDRRRLEDDDDSHVTEDTPSSNSEEQYQRLESLEKAKVDLKDLVSPAIQENRYTSVDLIGQNLRTIPSSLHDHASQIITLSLSRNPSLEIPPDFIQSCTSLQKLEVSEMGMDTVPSSIQNSITLEHLDISFNRIANLDWAGVHLNQLPNLRELDVQNNLMETLPRYLSQMDSLTTLNISNNKFRTIPLVVCQLPRLQNLDISFNLIEELPTELGRLTELERFIFAGNRVSSFSAEMQQLLSLRHLDCSRNLIEDLAEVSTLTKLETLYIDQSLLQSLDPSLWSRLIYLDASNNEVAKLTLRPEIPEIQQPAITIVFTRISNSTRLWQVNPAMLSAVDTYNRLLRQQLALFGGQEMKSDPDTFLCSFSTTLAALKWSMMVQQKLLEEEWPAEILESPDGKPVYDEQNRLIARGLSACMGIHCGSHLDSTGPIVDLSARISAVALAGQIICSEDVMREVNVKIFEVELETEYSPSREMERLGIVIVVLGEMQVEGLDEPQRLSFVYPSSLETRRNLHE